MGTNVPPDFLPIVYDACLNKALYITVEFTPGDIRFGNATAGERAPNYRTVRFQACQTPTPERGIGGDGEQMRDPGAQLIHERYSDLMIFNADVYMQAKD